MPFLITPTPHVWQPQHPTAINWNSPLARGLVFCAVPVGDRFLDLVSGEWGTKTGTTSPGFRAKNDGFSHRSDGNAIAGNGGTGDYFIWPVSTFKRGGNVVQTGTILALASTTTQAGAAIYPIGGNTEDVSVGNGFSLGIDQNNQVGIGNIIRANYNDPLGTSTTAFLGSTYAAKTHFFGYSYRTNGSVGTYFGARRGETWTGGTTFGTTTSNRRAYVGAFSASDSLTKPWYVLQLLIWNRELSLAEYQALYDNPWQIFSLEPRRLFLDGGGAGTTNGVFDAAAIATITGVGASTAAAAGSIAGTASVVGVGAATSASDGSSAGTASIVGVGASSVAGDFDSTGTASVVGISAAAGVADGDISAQADVVGVGSSTVSADGSIAGTTSVVGVGASTAAGVFDSAGTLSMVGVGTDATVSTDMPRRFDDGNPIAWLSNDPGWAAIYGREQQGIPQGNRDTPLNIVEGDGDISGVSSIVGVGASTVAGVFDSQGVGQAQGVGASTVAGVFSSDAQFDMVGIPQGAIVVTADGAAEGWASVIGIGASTNSGAFDSTGTLSMVGVSEAEAEVNLDGWVPRLKKAKQEAEAAQAEEEEILAIMALAMPLLIQQGAQWHR